MARQYWRPSNLLYPVPPVMISCADEEGRSNIMTAAWTGTICSDPVMVSVSIRPERYSHDVIARTGEFVINLTTQELAYAADFCGVRSGRDIDKFETLHLTRIPSRRVSAPSIGESPVCLECVVTAIEKLGTHDLFIAKVVQVSVDDAVLDGQGRLDLERAGLVAYVHGAYLSLGERLGTFGFSVRKKTGGAAGKSSRREKKADSQEVSRAAGKSAGRAKTAGGAGKDRAAGKSSGRAKTAGGAGKDRAAGKFSGRAKTAGAGKDRAAGKSARRAKTAGGAE